MPSSTNELKKILDRQGLTQTQLAFAANVAIGTVNKTCNMRYTPAPKTMSRLIIGLNALSGKEFVVDDVFPDRGINKNG